ncbi:Helix-turn-helix domain-containing protein [Nitrosomonas marina]|uniref:Helix-turn-helix domain-containing protein n=1 Tax=Nitrosomonas marina TaxID=917 RepID=A0A1I0E7V6_9PROT|nr:helix-turn-helix transcriptional regulator [Nitrosomonas marina]SET41091.1 Helix-turn-helix domain-containing protein [Nitrosomonas marina]
MSKKSEDSPSSPAARVALARSIGKRLKMARERAGFTQVDAAEQLGYTNSSKLAKVERATDTNSVPLWLILRAARVYETSIDFIFGETDDWEIGYKSWIERDVSKWVFTANEQFHLREMEILKSLMMRTKVIHDSVEDMSYVSQELEQAMRRFIELNSGFETDMRGGSRLLAAIEKVCETAKRGKKRVDMFGKECNRRFKQKDPQPTLDLQFDSES